jgi:hypothetical protein
MAEPYTKEQLNFIRDNCKLLEDAKLAEAFNATFGLNKTAGNMKSTRTNHGFLTGRTGRFSPGQKPSPNARPAGPNSTSFKKGNRPHNWMPVGSERVNGDDYIDVKVAEPNVWVYKQRLIFEAAHGPIPDGHCVIFKDGDNRNFDISNLVLVDRKELAVMNKMQVGSLPVELKDSGLLLAKLKIKTAAARRRAS